MRVRWFEEQDAFGKAEAGRESVTGVAQTLAQPAPLSLHDV
jgi:hypothetical protein